MRIGRLAIFGSLLLAVAAFGDDTRRLGDPFFERRREAVEAWIREGDPGLARARQAVTGPDHRARGLALEVLGRAGGEADAAVAVRSLGSPDRETRVAAGEALARLVARGILPAVRALPAEIAARPEVRAGIAQWARDELLGLALRERPVEWSHDGAYRGFVRLGGLVLPTLRGIAFDRRYGPPVRGHAIVAIGRSAGAEGIPVLLEVWRRHRGDVPRIPLPEERPGAIRAATVAALALLGESSPEVLEILLEATDDFEDNVRNWANWGLVVLAPRFSQEARRRVARRCVAQLGEEGSEAVLSVVALALEATGEAEDAGAIREALSGRPRFVDFYLLDSLRSLAPEDAATRGEMERQLASVNPAARGYATFALGLRADDDLVAALLDLLDRNPTGLEDDEGFGVRTACLALGILEIRKAVPDLVRKSSDEWDSVRAAAAAALGSLGGDEAVAALAALLDDRYEYARFFAAESLHRLGESRCLGGYIDDLDGGNRFLADRALAVLREIRGGDAFGFRSDASGEERAAAAGRWREWWSAHRGSLVFDAETGVFRLP